MRIVLKNSKGNVIVEAECLHYTFDDYWDKLIMLEMTGPSQAVRAIWAAMAKKVKKDDTWAGKTDVYVEYLGTEYRVGMAPKPVRYTRFEKEDSLLMISSELNERNARYFLGEESLGDVPANFISAIKGHVDELPVLPEWGDKLWKLGMDNGAILPAKTFTDGRIINVFKVQGNDTWKRLIKENPTWLE